MPLNETVLRGLSDGVDRHWRYAKDLLRVKPEYLLTISVADAIANSGYGEVCGLDLAIKLEEPTHRIVGHLWMHGVGFKRYFKERSAWLGRRGKVDIFVQHEIDNACHIVELKNFDPSAWEVRKDLQRFVDFLEINGRVNPLQSCHLAFPTAANRQTWLEKQVKSISCSGLSLSIESRQEETGEDPEDGIPAYYCNVIGLAKAEASLPGNAANLRSASLAAAAPSLVDCAMTGAERSDIWTAPDSDKAPHSSTSRHQVDEAAKKYWGGVVMSVTPRTTQASA